MKTKDNANNDILQTTMNIQAHFPELLKYISEMQVTIPDEKNPDITVVLLEDYNNTLKIFSARYAQRNDK